MEICCCRSRWPRGLKVWVCGRSLAGIAGASPAGGVFVSCECCVLSRTGRCDGPLSLQRTPTWFVCVCVCVCVCVTECEV
jgi:hypothetical protein